MYLQSMEINGFKSFANKGNFLFNSRISGIVGPNGSGKSNVAEAFRFVLGEQSFKQMRSKRGTDLLFAGEKSQANRARVAVTFDNSNRTLDSDYKTITCERVLLRDGSNEYILNGEKVRAKDITELLASGNIGSSGHHIISQGEADKILMINARERKSVIEEALGLKVFTIKKQEAERKLERTEENLGEVRTNERAVAPRIAMLKREVEKIERTRELRDQLRELYKQFLPGLNKTRQELVTIKQAREQLVSDQTQIHREIQEKQALRVHQQSEQNNAQTQQALVQERQQLELLHEKRRERERTLARLEVELEMLHEERERVLARRPDVQSQSPEIGHDQRALKAVFRLHAAWAHELLKRDDLTDSLREYLIGYDSFDQLPDDERERLSGYIDLLQDESIDKSPGVDAASRDDFDEARILEKQNMRDEVENEISKLVVAVREYEQRIDSLEKSLVHPKELDQQIAIEILELEKRLTEKNSAIREQETLLDRCNQTLSHYATEQVFARDLFGKESEEFEQGSVTDDLNIREKIVRVRILLENAGSVSGEEVMTEYKELTSKREYVQRQIDDLEQSAASLTTLIQELEQQIEEQFREGMDKINNSFNEFFKALFSGGTAQLQLVQIPVGSNDDPDTQQYELGVEMSVVLPNKKISSLSMLSGGERSLTSIALLFAMSQVAPPPFIILDETDAALDEANSKRYGDMVEQLAQHSQLIVITHNRETMSRASILYGVTMGDDGVSRLLSVSLDEAEAVAK